MPMIYVHNAKITVFIKPEEYFGKPEVLENAKKVFHKLIPFDFEKEKLSITEETVESFENRKIKIFGVEIFKEAHTNSFIKNLKELLGEDSCKKLLDQRGSRLDDELCFYIRLDKDALLKDVTELTDSGECFHIKMHVAAFPKNKTAALKVVEEMLK